MVAKYQKHYSCKHKLIDNNPQGKKISFKRMTHSTDNLRRHITWSSTRIFSIILPPLPCHPKVSYSSISIRLQNDILWFYVSMDNFIGVDIG